MAACDYEECAKCVLGKTIYSANIDWPEGVVVLCPDCASALANANDIAAAAVAAEREAIAAMIEATAYTSNGDTRSLQPVSDGLHGMDMHHATIAAAIRNRGKS